MVNEAPGVHLGRGDCSTRPEPVECLLHRHAGVVALIVGHQHRNRIEAHPRPGGGFWEIVTAAHTDWPQQSRLIDLVDNADGTLSLLTSVVDHLSDPQAPRRPPRAGRVLSRAEVQWLASVGRELAYNDPQESPGRSGTRQDRNVELVVRNPYAPTP
jgi:hypothetical protein